MSEKHIKEKNLKRAEKSFVVLESKLMQPIKEDTEAMFFSDYLPTLRSQILLFQRGGCWSFCYVLMEYFTFPFRCTFLSKLSLGLSFTFSISSTQGCQALLCLAVSTLSFFCVYTTTAT